MIPVEVPEDIELAIVREGRVQVEVPVASTPSTKGPARADAPVFYNPAMELARDVSVSLVRATGSSSWRVLDGLAGTGIRGVRYAVEGPSLREVVLNDINPVAAALCRKNLDRNDVTSGQVTRRRLESLLLEDHFDMVDVDPFGSPSVFLPGAVRAVRREGIIAVTATDTPALCGSKPRPCIRRYGARPWRGDAMHEVALRILAGAVIREAARVDKAAVPVLSMSEDHFVRVFLRVSEGARKADAILASMGYAWATDEGSIGTGPAPPPRADRWAGPLWLGHLHDPGILGTMAADEGLEPSKRHARLLDRWREEAELPPLLIDGNRLASRIGTSTPRMANILEALRSGGYAAGRAHTNPVGIKTDAPLEVLESVFRDLEKGG